MSFRGMEMLATLGFRIDAFFRATCPKCLKASVFIRTTDRIHAACESCGWMEDGFVIESVARHATCGVCRRLAFSDPRCLPCEADWQIAGRPAQNVMIWREFHEQPLVARFPRVDFARAVAAAAAYLRAHEPATDRPDEANQDPS